MRPTESCAPPSPRWPRASPAPRTAARFQAGRRPAGGTGPAQPSAGNRDGGDLLRIELSALARLDEVDRGMLEPAFTTAADQSRRDGRAALAGVFDALAKAVH